LRALSNSSQLDDRDVRGADREQHLLASLLIWLGG
jgi:hypothetical protein